MRCVLTNSPTAMPGCCKLCGGVKTPMVDMCYSEDYYGAIYYCIECITEIAGIMGFVDNSKVKNLLQQISFYEDKIISLQNIGEDSIKFIQERLNNVQLSTVFSDFISQLQPNSNVDVSVQSTLPKKSTVAANVSNANDSSATAINGPSNDKNMGTVLPATDNKTRAEKSVNI